MSGIISFNNFSKVMLGENFNGKMVFQNFYIWFISDLFH